MRASVLANNRQQPLMVVFRHGRLVSFMRLAGSFISGCGSRSAFDQSELRTSTGGLGNSAVSTGGASATTQLAVSGGVITGDTFGVWRSGVVTLIAQHPCDGKTQFLSLWGNSESEVFVAYSDAGRANDTCGNIAVMWFDGNSLSPL